MKRPPLHPIVWKPPPTPARARQPSGPRPLPPLRVLEVGGTGPEDVALDAEGRIIAGLEDGRIVRLSPDGGRIETLASTGGRPLGIEVAADGRLLICDARRGLLRADPENGEVELLVEGTAGEPFRFCNNAAVAPDGTVYFSDTSRHFGIEHWKADILEHTGTGRLLLRDPDGSVEVLLDGLQFANGVALAPDGSFLLVVETAAYRITRLWLTGSRAGEAEVFADNLPGFPDNLSTGSDGLFWVALPDARNPLVDRLLPMPPFLRVAVWALPERLQPAPKRTVWAMAFDESGNVVHDLQGPGERFHMVTGVRERDGQLYLGSLADTAVAVLTVPEPDGPGPGD
ncbi:MAG: SMP-30/gluconolactonase/LRE family protein [Streptosporangiales bacterium]|nr:SMP-30/gluconolactonase/LRE family protein [Streptosporangiales bacterium]